MNITNDNAVKYYKKDRFRFMLGILFLCAILALALYCYLDALHKISRETDMSHAENTASQKGDTYLAAYIDTNEALYAFAGDESGAKLYDIARGTDSRFYILKLDSSKEAEINQTVAEGKSAHIRGITSPFDSPRIRKHALEALREIYPDTEFSEESGIAFLQLNATEITPFKIINIADGWYALVMIFFFAAAILLLPQSISRLEKWKAVTPAEAAVYDAEMSAGTSWLPTLGIYAADSRMYGLANGFTVCSYSEIAMLYKEVYRYNYIKTSERITVLNKSGKTLIPADIPINPLQRIKESEIDTELEFLGKTAAACNPDIFLGYDKEVYGRLYKQYRKKSK